ncbi:DEKNAAC102871 [Brettanomyces naardenensis]|uniref:U3 small nucleolar RNA-associated protein 22 n=1 Tax=Brettanomyces naardenensis TaxID=13370 RepID=A0A448YLR3_BRENA|nr:DEKNAAC102871 [Brettanomyces naardenensis]
MTDGSKLGADTGSSLVADRISDTVNETLPAKRPSLPEQSHRGVSKRPKLTAQDVQVARETAELFKSNIFKLEIDELVHELKLKDTHCKLIERVLHRLYDIIQEIPTSGEMSLDQAIDHFIQSPTRIVIPFPDPKPTSVNYKFNYEPPEDTSLVGSFGLKTGIQQPKGMVIDVALTMPKKLFQQKDYMNYRALYKRAFYLAYVAENLIPLAKKHHLPIKLSYEYADGDVLCPTIRIDSYLPESPEEDDLIFEKTSFSIRLYVGFPFGLFDAKKLLPDRNCIRVKSEETELPPTPLYNASILTSSSYTCYLKYLYTAKKTSEAFRDACVLGKLWLRQRGFSSNITEGGFGHFEFATLMAALLDGGGEHGNRILLHGFSSFQLFKATIRYLATQDLCHEGYLSFCSVIGEHKSVYKPKRGFGVPTIFDKNTKINILWKMTPSSYGMLRKHAQAALDLLNDVVTDRFSQIFIQNANSKIMKFDAVIRIPLSLVNQETDGFGPLEKISFLTFERYVSSKIFKLLSIALKDRVTQIDVKVSETESTYFSIIHRRPSAGVKFVDIGLYLDAAESEKRVTKGPLHSQKVEGERFASFWGPKAQVRRYKDGNVQYSCLWPAFGTESPTITIAKYILDLHLQPGISKNMVVNSTKFNVLLASPLTASLGSSHPLIIPSHFQELHSSYDSLCKLIYNMESLPLTVKSILPASSSLRGTSLLLPVPFAITNPDFFNDSVMQFETSTRWPDELLTLERTKTAFLLKINAALQNVSGYTSYLTKDNSIPYLKDVVTTLNVLTPEGHGFRFSVLTERDELLYLRSIENADAKQKPAVTDSYIKFMQKYIGSVKHHRAINGLVTRFPFFGPTVRLFKQWIESQLLSTHFSEQLLELIAAKVFIDPAPYPVPSSTATGFLRILNFISHWNWREEPLILDLSADDADSITGTYIDKISGKLTVQEHQMMSENFRKLRKDDPSGNHVQFFVASREDPSGKLWSSNRVGLPMASRVTVLSKIVVSLLSRSEGISEGQLRLAFTPALKDYDFVIEVKDPEDMRARSGVLPGDTFKNLVPSLTEFPSDVSKFEDPVQNYFSELAARYSNVVVLSTHRYTCLSDEKEGRANVITGIFNPAVVHGKKKFRANIGFNVRPTEDEHVECNEEAILQQMVRLGGDLVVSFKRYH